MISLKKTRLNIVIATFNSSKYLGLVLDSVRKQNFDQKNITILIVDGGSTDETQKIAKSYGCKVINNPKVEPVSAKLLGIKYATGDYIMFLDADEILQSKNSIKNKISTMKSDKQIKSVIPSGYITPFGSSVVRNYINDYGDPFSFFVYRISKNNDLFIPSLRKKYMVKQEDSKSVVFNFFKHQTLPIVELGAAGSIIDLDYLKKTYRKIDFHVFAHLFYIIISKNQQVAVMKNDPLVHYSSDDLMGYLKKIQWRIRNNIFFKSNMGEAGFNGRTEYLSKTSELLKYMFIPYSWSLFLPLFDAIKMVIDRKDWRYLIHFILVEYTAFYISLYYFLFLLGFRPELRSYDQKHIISKNSAI